MVREEVKKGILWEKDDFLHPRTGAGVDLLFLRNNLLTYYQEPVRVAALARIAESLENSGYLVIGRDERIPYGYGALSSVGSSGCLYRKKIQAK